MESCPEKEDEWGKRVTLDGYFCSSQQNYSSTRADTEMENWEWKGEPDTETFFMDVLDRRTWRWFAGNALKVTPTGRSAKDADKDRSSRQTNETATEQTS